MDGSSGPLIVAMKGHPGTGKTTLARALAAALRCPLLDKDDVRDCTLLLQQHLQSATTLNSPDAAAGMLNELSYSVLWRLAETQLLRVGLGAVVIDSPLSDRRHLDRLLAIAERAGGRVVVVECRSKNEGEWRRRLEDRGREAAEAAAAAAEGKSGANLEGWHKPATWEKLKRLVDGYGGRADYDMGKVPRLIVDTTAADGGGVEGAVERVTEFVGLSVPS